MVERKKLELELNKTMNLELLFDEPMVGQSRYGDYFLYAVKNGTDTEYSFFAPEEVHEKIKSLRKGDRFEVVKLAEQKGTKIITKYEVKALSNPKTEVEKKDYPLTAAQSNSKDTYYQSMLSSYQDALKIQEQLNGMVDVNRIAITLFIARSKIKGGELS